MPLVLLFFLAKFALLIFFLFSKEKRKNEAYKKLSWKEQTYCYIAFAWISILTREKRIVDLSVVRYNKFANEIFTALTEMFVKYLAKLIEGLSNLRSPSFTKLENFFFPQEKFHFFIVKIPL